ncbi:MAG: DUF4397 domain-containing protein [Acidimicrobiia bacterium]|nr:DUF4397 domain-containing protein [Acidimicrobiia bacterium]
MRNLGRIFIVAVLLLALPAGAALAQTTDGTVSVLHGIPGDGGFPVDIYVNGDYSAPFIPGLTFGNFAGPVTLPAADYSIEIYGAGADPASTDPALGPLVVTLPAGANATIEAHLDEAGAATASVFVNDISEIAAGDTRLTVRHTAAAPTVDVLANDGVLFAGLSNPNEAAGDVPAATYNAKVVPTGATDPVVFEADLDLAEGTSTIVYAIGSLEGGSFTVAVQTISGLGAAPTGVPTGDAGLASDGFPLALALAGGMALIGLAGSGVALTRRSGK